MKRVFILLCLSVFAVGSAFAQTVTKTQTTVVQANTPQPAELAKLALTAIGGEKFKKLKNIVLRGSAELSGSPTQRFPATFVMVYEGEKYSFDIQAPPIINFKQVYDGEETYSSSRNINMPPLNRIGFSLLVKMDEKGYVVAALPEKLKKKRGFRITSPEGYYTDFIIDEKTNLVKEYEASFDYNGTTVSTAVAIDSYKEVNGVKINEKFSQRIEMGQITAYADFKAKDVLVDTELPKGTFAL
jgi:hypothetical protein